MSLLVSSAVAGADDATEGLGAVAVGSRVRLLAPSAVGGRIQGLVLQANGETLLVGSDHGAPVRVPNDAITRLEVSTGRRGQAVKGMAIGAAIGAGVFAAYPEEDYCVEYGEPDEPCPSRGEMVGVGAAGGALWGLLIGHFVKTDRWSPVPLSHMRVSLAPTRAHGGWGAALSVGW